MERNYCKNCKWCNKDEYGGNLGWSYMWECKCPEFVKENEDLIAGDENLVYPKCHVVRKDSGVKCSGWRKQITGWRFVKYCVIKVWRKVL